MFRFFQNLFAAEDESKNTNNFSSTSASDQTTSPPVMNDGSHYILSVQVKKTGDGPGHASITSKKTGSDGTVLEKTHTSYTVADPVSLVIGAVTIGSVPVASMNRSDDSEDLRDADAILTKEVSQNAYIEAKAAQARIEELISTGTTAYSVTGPSNPIAAVAATMAESANAVYAYQRDHGGVEHEDLCGIAMGAGDRDSSPTLEIHNCVSTTTAVLTAAGVDTSEVFYPTEFIEELENKGFILVNQDNAEEKIPFIMGM